ncbi:MAG TPA: type II toxin-antitoxin system prevent-host-death family antitoxin [Bdellovibrionota bacterium]|nr:type II toxin-antitoxin system prevent-host-death family antitoxin [Bdellovibrionota bacterium]
MKGKLTVTISEFKAKALALIAETAKKGREYIVTKNGVPVARVSPIKPIQQGSRRGRLKGLAEIHGDIVHFDTSGDWEVLKT